MVLQMRNSLDVSATGYSTGEFKALEIYFKMVVGF